MAFAPASAACAQLRASALDARLHPRDGDADHLGRRAHCHAFQLDQRDCLSIRGRQARHEHRQARCKQLRGRLLAIAAFRVRRFDGGRVADQWMPAEISPALPFQDPFLHAHSVDLCVAYW
ncbi:MAG: hypothetical protein M3680_00195 [Myxococcota bacterium]|nr:hypothetical protein [Myxococcota bacterium]